MDTRGKGRGRGRGRGRAGLATVPLPGQSKFRGTWTDTGRGELTLNRDFLGRGYVKSAKSETSVGKKVEISGRKLEVPKGKTLRLSTQEGGAKVTWAEEVDGMDEMRGQWKREAEEIWKQAREESVRKMREELKKREDVWIADMRRRIRKTAEPEVMTDRWIFELVGDVEARVQSEVREVREELMRVIDERIREVNYQMEVQRLLAESDGEASESSRLQVVMPDPCKVKVIRRGDQPGLWLPLVRTEVE